MTETILTLPDSYVVCSVDAALLGLRVSAVQRAATQLLPLPRLPEPQPDPEPVDHVMHPPLESVLDTSDSQSWVLSLAHRALELEAESATSDEARAQIGHMLEKLTEIEAVWTEESIIDLMF